MTCFIFPGSPWEGLEAEGRAEGGRGEEEDVKTTVAELAVRSVVWLLSV